MPEQKPSKIKKVTLEYEGATYVAEGAEAEAWLTRINAMETVFGIFQLPDFEWTSITKKTKKKGG